MDLFGVSGISSACHFDLSKETNGPCVNQEPSAPGERVSPRTRESQLSLGLPSLPLNQYSWTDLELDELREGVLRNQLRLLADERTTAELRADLIAWVAAPKRNPKELKLVPFSFQVCCAAAGVDFEEMRERTLALFARELIETLD